MSRKDKITPSVVDAVREQTAQAAALAEIDGQHRLADPRLNPATRRRADELRTEQLTRALDAEHARLLRRHRVADRRAAEAERALEALALAREASSPARAVLALHKGRSRYMRISMAASVVLAAGSAMGVEQVATEVFHAPAGTGYIAEVGLTGLATLAIHYRAHLAEHRGELVKGSWQSNVLWTLMTVPLLLSVTANLAKTNAIGAACALGAAAFSALAWVIADRSAAAMQARAAEVSEADEAELLERAAGEDLFSAPAPEPSPERDERQDDGQDHADAGTGVRESRGPVVPYRSQDDSQDYVDAEDGDSQDDGEAGGEGESSEPLVVRDPVAVEADRGAAELERWLADQEPPEAGAASSAPSPGGDGPHGAAAEATIRPGVHIDAEQGGRDDRGDGSATGPDRPDQSRPGRVLPAIEARRAVGASTRQRIVEYLAENPTATVPQIATDLGLSRTTVKRHRQELRRMQQAAARRATHGGER